MQQLPESVKYVLLPLQNDHDVAIFETPVVPAYNPTPTNNASPSFRPRTPVMTPSRSPSVSMSPNLASSENNISLFQARSNRNSMSQANSRSPSPSLQRAHSPVTDHKEESVEFNDIADHDMASKCAITELRRRYSEIPHNNEVISSSTNGPNVVRTTLENLKIQRPSLFSLQYWFPRKSGALSCPTVTHLVDEKEHSVKSFCSKTSETSYSSMSVRPKSYPEVPENIAESENDPDFEPGSPQNEDVSLNESSEAIDLVTESDDLDSHLPLECEKFVSRQVEVHRLISLIQQFSFVNVFGQAMIGKTSVICRAAKYLQQRRTVRSIFYISYKDFLMYSSQIVKSSEETYKSDVSAFLGYIAHIVNCSLTGESLKPIERVSMPESINSFTNALSFVASEAKLLHSARGVSEGSNLSEPILFIDDLNNDNLNFNVELCNTLISLLRRGRGAGGFISQKIPSFRIVLVTVEPVSANVSAQSGIFAGSLCIGGLTVDACVELVRSVAPFLNVDQAKVLSKSNNYEPCKIRNALVKLLQDMARIESQPDDI